MMLLNCTTLYREVFLIFCSMSVMVSLNALLCGTGLCNVLVSQILAVGRPFERDRQLSNNK